MTTNLRQNKEPKYFCYDCNFKSSKKSDYTRHISTAKHLMTTKGLQKNANALCCECGKIYSCRQNLFRHRAKCAFLRQESAIFKETVISSENDKKDMNTETILNEM